MRLNIVLNLRIQQHPPVNSTVRFGNQAEELQNDPEWQEVMRISQEVRVDSQKMDVARNLFAKFKALQEAEKFTGWVLPGHNGSRSKYNAFLYTQPENLSTVVGLLEKIEGITPVPQPTPRQNWFQRAEVSVRRFLRFPLPFDFSPRLFDYQSPNPDEQNVHIPVLVAVPQAMQKYYNRYGTLG